MKHEPPKHLQFQATGCMAVLVLTMLATSIMAAIKLLIQFIF